MRTYGGRFLRNSVQRQVARRVESRDALLVSVDTEARRALVKIQGSSATVAAYFPENMSSAEPWMKPGNAVRISHTGGQRGRIELVGHGATIPTLLPGDTTVITPVKPDVILSGLRLIKIVTNTLEGMFDLHVVVTAGTARFDGEVITYGAPVMGDATPMGSEDIMGFPGRKILMPSQPMDGLMRYDTLSIGPDGVVDVFSGIAGNPPEWPVPDTPVGNLLIGWALRTYSGEIATHYSINIGARHETPVAEIVQLRLGPTADLVTDEMAWGDNPELLTVTVTDTTGQMSSPAAGRTITATITAGNGQLAVAGSPPAGTTAAVYTTASVVEFEYYRGNSEDDASPIIEASISTGTYYATASILLLDSGGNPMT